MDPESYRPNEHRRGEKLNLHTERLLIQAANQTQILLDHVDLLLVSAVPTRHADMLTI